MRSSPTPRRAALALAALMSAAACTEPEELHDPMHPEWPPALAAIIAEAEADYGVPTVAVVDVDSLPEGTPILDVRTAAEASVSVIPGSTLLADKAAQKAWLASPAKGPVLVSCAAGVRSARFTRTLREAGVEAYNLEGGIFAWAAAGKPVLDPDGKPTKRVHTYNTKWAPCLVSDHEAVQLPKP